jgi:uncharacterized membrane protein
MNVVKLAMKRGMALPMLALGIASGVCVILVSCRIIWTGRTYYGGLVWNLFLAWLPLVFALLACERFERASHRDWRFAGLAALWLLFFPNSPYILTDILHLVTRSYYLFWVDLVVVLLCAFTGLILGFLSVFLLQGVVARLKGKAASWWFVAVASLLGGFGIYLGRFMRFNSWDVFTKPSTVYKGIGIWAKTSSARSTGIAFPLLFALFLFLTYLLLYALTHLKQAHHLENPPGPTGANASAPAPAEPQASVEPKDGPGSTAGNAG